MRVTYYDEFTRLTRLKPTYAWVLRIMVTVSLVVLIVKML